MDRDIHLLLTVRVSFSENSLAKYKISLWMLARNDFKNITNISNQQTFEENKMWLKEEVKSQS